MSFLSDLHKDIRSVLLTRRGATRAPNEVPIGVHKVYERMERVALPNPVDNGLSVLAVLNRRQSYTGTCIDSGEVLTLQEVGTLFGGALGRKNKSWKRMYPSGGGLYPIETYFVSTGFEGNQAGVFHYNPSEHALERLWDIPDGVLLSTILPRPETLKPSHVIVFTSVWDRSSAKYGDLTYSHALLEAGHMSENVILVGTALGLLVRPMAGFVDSVVSSTLDLDVAYEQVVHSIAIRKGGIPVEEGLENVRGE